MAELDVFLGTCACDFSPLLQTDKKNCFDKDVRRSSSILLNGHMLVECGPHTLHAPHERTESICSAFGAHVA